MNFKVIIALLSSYAVSNVMAACAAFQAYLEAHQANPDLNDPAIKGFTSAVADAACVGVLRLTGGGAPQFASLQLLTEALNRVPSAVEAIAANDQNFLNVWNNEIQYFTADSLSIFVNHQKKADDHCILLNQVAEAAIAGDRSKAQKLSPQCFAYLLGVSALPDGLKNFKDDILKNRTKPMAHASFYNMTVKQLENYHTAGNLKATRCQENFRVDLLSKDLIAKIPSDCLVNWLEYNSNAWNEAQVAALRVGSLKKLTAQGAKNLAVVIRGFENKLHKDVVNFLAGNPIYSPILKPESIRKDTIVKKKECFTVMQADTKLVVMEIVPNLPDNILEDTLPSEIAGFNNAGVARSEKNKCEAYACLNLLDKRKNVKAILAKLNDYHCMDRILASLTSATTFTKHMSKTCFKQCEDAKTFEDYNDIDENVYKYISVELVKKFFKGDWISHAEDYVKNKSKKNYNSIWRGVLRNPKVCRSLVKLKTFKKLRKNKLVGAMSAFSSECCRAMRFLRKLDAEDLKAIGPNLYAAFTKADKAKINLEKASPEQIARISSDVTDLSDHYAAQVTAETLATYSPELVASLPEPWYRAFPAETYAGFTHEQFEGIPADNTVNMTAEKIEQLVEDVMKGLTPEQISLIGSGANQEKEIMAILEKYIGGYDEQQKKAYNGRLEVEGSGAVSLAVAGLVSFTVGLTLLIPLL